MHPRIDLGLILCAFGLHDLIRVADRSVHGRAVVYRRCIRCSRTPAARARQDDRSTSRYT